MKKFKTYKEILDYAAVTDRNLKCPKLIKTVTIKHIDGSVLKLTHCHYEKVRDSAWKCEVIGKDFKVIRTIVGEDVHITWSEHHGYHVYYNSDLKKIEIKK